jgi:hypothetical protein
VKINLRDFKKKPCPQYLKFFNENGEADVNYVFE